MNCSQWFLSVFAVLVLAAGPAAGAEVTPVQAVSLADPTLPVSVTGNGFSASPVVSSNGLWVAFASQASNLTTNDFAGNPRGQWLNVFVRNLATGRTTLVSVTPDGTAGGNDNSYAPVLSADGRFVAFESRASNLVTNDNNGAADIFVRDLQTGVTRLVSANNAGTGSGDGDSTNPNVTPDGRYVVFESTADDLVANDTNGIADIFVRDLQTETTTLVSANAQAVYGGEQSDAPVITADGRWVAFESTATNLVAGVTNFLGEVYVRDVVNGVTYWASTNATPIAESVTGMTQSRSSSMNPALSGDGRYVAFTWEPSNPTNTFLLRQDLQTGHTDLIATNLPLTVELAISADGRWVAYASLTGTNSNPLTSSNTTILIWDAQTATNTLVSVNTNGVPANGQSDTPAFTPDGHSIAFFSDASDLVTNPLDGNSHLFVRDLSTGVTQLIDVDQNGTARGQPFDLPSFSADGSVVVFSSFDDQMTTNDLNAACDVFARNLTNPVTTLVSVRDPGMPGLTANGSSSLAANATSADGRFAVFTSDASNLVPNDTNGVPDVFVFDRLAGTHLLISANTNGVPANGASSSPVISADGRFVAFASVATDLAPNDTNTLPDIYLRDLRAGTTTLISVSLAGMAAGVDAGPPVVSADGRYVAFASTATGIVTNDLSPTDDLFVRDVWNGTTVRVPPPTGSPNSLLLPRPLPHIGPAGSLFLTAGGPMALYYYDYPTDSIHLVQTIPVGAVTVTPSVSADARFVAYQFRTVTSNLVFLYDAVTGSNTLVSSAVGASAVLNSGYQLSVSDDGRYVAFVCDFPNLVTNDTNNAPDVFVVDTQNPGHLTLVSLNRAGTGTGNAASDSPTMSRDGRFVAFRSSATDLVAEPTGGQPNIYLRDLQSGTTTLVSVNRAGTAGGNWRSTIPVVSADGTVVLFNSAASDLADGDFNNLGDVFYANNPIVGRAFPSWSNGNVTVTWTANPGRVYRLQYKNSLTGTNDWITISDDVTADHGTAAKPDTSAATAAQRLYRVLLVR